MGLQETLRALSDPTRREILDMLKTGRLSAGEIGERFDVSAPAISRHLGVLRDAGLVRDKREGKFIFYEINLSVVEEVFLWLKGLEVEYEKSRAVGVDHHSGHGHSGGPVPAAPSGGRGDPVE